MGLDIRVRRRSFQSPCSHANASLRMEHHRHYCCINLRPLGADVCPATQKENLVMEPDEIDLDDDLTADYDSSLDYQTDEKAYPASTKINANMHWAAALLFGTWYSIILGSAMSAGFKYLHPDTPYAHGIIQSLAWAIGSGVAIAVASRLSTSHRLAVGLSASLLSASVWVALLFMLRDDLDVPSGDSVFGYPISIGEYLVDLSVLILLIGFVASFMGAKSRNDEDDIAPLLMMPTGHWLWLWIALFGWVSIFPIMAYYIWLQIAVAIYSIIHPSLWFQAGSDLFFGFLGIMALFAGVGISFKAVSDKQSYGGIVWKRFLAFLGAGVILATLVSPILLNIDISSMKDMPASLGNNHPWWIL